MVEANDANIDSAKKDKMALAKIEPVKAEVTSPDVESSNIKDASVSGSIESEKSLISATILLYANMALESGAAVRDNNISHQYFGPREAVSSLSNLGFKASFGRLTLQIFPTNFFLIAFKKMAKRLLF